MPSLMGLVLRYGAAFLLVVGTYNPVTVNYIDWVGNGEPFSALKLLAGIGLFIGFAVYISAVKESIGKAGAFLVVVLVGSVVWLMSSNMGLSLDSGDVWIWIAIVTLSLIMGVGMSASFFRRMLTGQRDMT